MAYALLIVDDHPIYLEGLKYSLSRLLPDFAIHTAPTYSHAVARCLDLETLDLCLTDERLPDGCGLDLVKDARLRAKPVRVGLLCSDVTPALAARVKSAGGSACLSKERDCPSIVAAIRLLLDGSQIFDSLVGRISVLSERRQEIVKMAASGMRDKQISQRLQITEFCVRNHWLHIFAQLGALNRTEAVSKALKLRLI